MLSHLSEIPDLILPPAGSGDSAVYRLQNESGNGAMTCYEVFPGAMLMYNNFHMDTVVSRFRTSADLLCIDYCREGRLEYAVGEDTFSYVEAGDLKIDRRLEHQGNFSFPLAHYQGITISFELPLAAQEAARVLGDGGIDLSAIQRKFCSDARPCVIHGAPSIDHIFHELYAVPERIRLPYFKVKVLELLLYLDALAPPDGLHRPYFYKSQVETVKSIRRYMTEHLDQRFTLEELSARFHIAPTTLKACFKSVFGNPVHTYMRIQRMNHAAILLRQEPDTNVLEIAGRVGYDSASKFAAAFKAVMGKSPTEYRKE